MVYFANLVRGLSSHFFFLKFLIFFKINKFIKSIFILLKKY
jgi:hypothetical protein